MELRQRGRMTYPRNMFKWIFNPNLLEKDLDDLIVKCKHSNKLSYRFNSVKEWTMYGPSGDLIVHCQVKSHLFTIKIGNYINGWIISLVGLDRYELPITWRVKVFDDPNKNSMWTQETELVPKLVDELIEKLEEAVD